jgi:hypothetical protein
VVYKLCISIAVGGATYETQEYIDYNTAIRHQGNVYNHKIEVPKSLLRIEDLQESYKNLVAFTEYMN